MKIQTSLYPVSIPCLFVLKTNSQTICHTLNQPIPIRRNPNPVRQRDPFPGHHRHPTPIHPPIVYPHPRHRCPCLKKEDETSAFQKDNGKRPGIRRSTSHPVFIHTTEEYPICGYETGGRKIGRLILGYEKENGALCYRGRINLGDEKMDELVIRSYPKQRTCPFSEAGGFTGIKAVWLMPGLNCLIQCSQKSPGGIIQSGIYCTLTFEQAPNRQKQK